MEKSSNNAAKKSSNKAAKKPSNEAALPNPALRPLARLIGRWQTTATHPLAPGTTFHGETTFDWLEEGAFLIMRSEVEEPGIPSGIAIFGSDDVLGKYYILYFDERKVSRKFDVTVNADTLEWYRDAPGFSQRMTLTISADGNTIVAKGELSKDNRTWEKDMEQTFTRLGDAL